MITRPKWLGSSWSDEHRKKKTLDPTPLPFSSSKQRDLEGKTELVIILL